MKVWRPVFIAGIIIFIFGIIFYLQSQSVVGPKSSFMYANPEWELNGIQIAVAGLLTSFFGIGLGFIKRA